MAKPSTDITPQELEKLAYEYVDECIKNTKEHVTVKGDVIPVKDRHIPTIGYFLRIWITSKGLKTINRSTYYDWLNYKPKEEDKSEKAERHRLKSNTIKKIDNLFKDLATDIVANEGKGIFYAKNKLGMSDKQEVKATVDAKPMFGDNPLDKI